jgi:hypothetical protein
MGERREHIMNCQQTRAAVDTASNQNNLTSGAKQHLASCPDCRHYSAGTFQLIALLAAQPRIEAPADFDFRLKARIARARDERHGWADSLPAFWMRWFSWKETAATLAMLAFVTVTATLYLTRRGETPRSDVHSAKVATVSEVKPTPGPASAEIASQGGVELPGLAGHRAVRAPVRLPVPVNAGGSRTLAVAAPVEIGGAQEILIYQPGRSGQPGLSRSVIVPRHGQVTWGAQLVGVQQAAATRPVPSNSAVETF